MAFHAEFFNQIKSLAWFHKKPFMWTLCTVCLIPDHGLSITLIINWPTEQNAKPVSTLFNYFAHKFIEIKITIFLLVTHALNCCEGFFTTRSSSTVTMHCNLCRGLWTLPTGRPKRSLNTLQLEVLISLVQCFDRVLHVAFLVLVLHERPCQMRPGEGRHNSYSFAL